MNKDQLKRIQLFLSDKGFNIGDIDGVLGVKTRQALTEYQRSASLKADGVPGPMTWNSMFGEKLPKPKAMDIVKKAIQLFDHKEYILGYEDDFNDPNPPASDCSEAVEITCHQCGVMPVMPDGSRWQYKHCRSYGTIIPVEQAIKTLGALLFVIDYDRGHFHVAISQGNGKTIECRGRRYGCGQFDADRPGWTHGALIPGVDYK